MKNRGMMLESLINKTIVIYKRQEVGIFHKIHIPIKFSNIKNDSGKLRIDNGFVVSKSTTDYYGIYKGIFVAFEAKSTNLDALPLANIKQHQSNYIRDIETHGGVAFYIVGFAKLNEYFIVEQDLLDSLERKSLTIQEARNSCHSIELEYPGILDFASYIDKRI